MTAVTLCERAHAAPEHQKAMFEKGGACAIFFARWDSGDFGDTILIT